MFSLPFLISNLYPEKEIAERQILVDKCLLVSDFNLSDWKKIKKEDLAKENTQLKLVKTLFRSQFNYDGTVGEIIYSLEDWFDGVFIDENFNDVSTLFYEHYYCFFGFLNFKFLRRKTQEYLLGSRYLVLAMIWDVSVYVNVEDYFTRLSSARLMFEDSYNFAESLRLNKTEIGDPKKIHKPISEWIKNFDDFFGSSYKNRIEEFFKDNIEISRLDEDQIEILEKVLTLYWGLKGGFIYREIEDILPDGYFGKKERSESLTERNYLEILRKAKPNEVGEWVIDFGNIAFWIFLTKKSSEYLQEIFLILKQKIDLKKDEQVDSVLKLNAILNKLGLEGADEVLLFDEKTGDFRWNEDYI